MKSCVNEVSDGLGAKLLLPLLTAKAKSLSHRLSADKTLVEFKLTSREYKARFNIARWDACFVHSSPQEPLGVLRKRRKCDNIDELVGLVVADRWKDSLSGPRLKYCLSLEGSKVLSSA